MKHQQIEKLKELNEDLHSAAIVLARASIDDGSRSSLDEVITKLGFDRETLEAELEAE